MGLFPLKYKVRFRLPSQAFVILVLASTIAAVFFAARLHLASQEIIQANIELENQIAVIPFSRDITPPAETKEEELIPESTGEVWGIAEQVGEKTWTMKVGQDEKMSTVEELHQALNNYRDKKGTGALVWDDKLAELAKMRAQSFYDEGTLDEHAGFKAYIEQDGKMEELGFWGLGENSSIGFQLEGVHLIEWIFAGDMPHESNQLDPTWTHVGIGIKGTAVDVVFGKK